MFLYCLIFYPLRFKCVLGASVVSRGSEDVLGQCNHEEADTRIVFHLRHCLERGTESILVRTVDIDVVVILVGKLHELLAYNQLSKVLVTFGMGCHFSLQRNLFFPWKVSNPTSLSSFHTELQFCGIEKKDNVASVGIE